MYYLQLLDCYNFLQHAFITAFLITFFSWKLARGVIREADTRRVGKYRHITLSQKFLCLCRIFIIILHNVRGILFTSFFSFPHKLRKMIMKDVTRCNQSHKKYLNNQFILACRSHSLLPPSELTEAPYFLWITQGGATAHNNKTKRKPHLGSDI